MNTTSTPVQLPRPTFNLQMSEAQWSFTKLQWQNHISQTNVSDAVKLTQLQAACSEHLRQRVFDTGLYSTLSTPDLFLAKMEEIKASGWAKTLTELQVALEAKYATTSAAIVEWVKEINAKLEALVKEWEQYPQVRILRVSSTVSKLQLNPALTVPPPMEFRL